MKRRTPQGRACPGFTFVELLVALGVFAVLVGLTAKPVSELVSSVVSTRRAAATASRNIAFLDLLGNDIRSAARIDDATNQSLVLASATGDPITWSFTASAATRNATSFPLDVKDLVIAPDQPAPQSRHIVLRGDFAGIGTLEAGFTIRSEKP